METGVFLLQGGDTLVRMVERPYEAESLLQVLLASHPDLLAGDQIDPVTPRRWLLIDREVGVPDRPDGADWWALDHLFLDQDAIPTFVEVKRAADTRARREVVAQMLDYAANATAHWPVDRMREGFARRCTERGLDPTDELAAVLDHAGDEAAFWDLAKRNLHDGRVRLLFVADRIPASLQRIIEFLNRQMNPAEVLAVEIRQFAPTTGSPERTLVPRVIGQTEQTRQAKVAARPPGRQVPITRQEYLDALPPDRRDRALAILQIAEAHGFVVTGHRGTADEGFARLTLPGISGTPLSLDPTYFWVSLGRHHPALREPAANRAIRQAILRVALTARQADNPAKSEVGIPLDAITPAGREHLPALFTTLRAALTDTPP